MDQFAHVAGPVAGGALTPAVEQGAQFARTGTGVFTLTVNAGMGSPAQALRATVSKTGAVFHSVEATSETVTTVKTFNAAGAAADPTYLIVTLDRLPRIA